MALRLIEWLLCFGACLVSGSLFGGQGRANGFAAFLPDMEEVGRVMGTELVCNRGHNPRRLITGGLHHLTVELGQGRCHAGRPGRLITGLSELFQENEVAHRIACHQAKAACEGFVLGHGDDFVRHGRGQAWDFCVLGVDDGVFDLHVDRLLRPVGSHNKPVQAGEVAQEPHQTHAARTDLDTDQMQGSNEPMEQCHARTALKKLGHMGAHIECVTP
jgi:hypothetical protein